MATLDQETAAEIAGLTTRRLQYLDKDGDGPSRTTRGGYPAREFGEWLRRRVMADFGVAGDGQAYDLEAERARLAKEQADGHALKNAEAVGELVRLSVVERMFGNALSVFRANTLAISTKLAPELAGLTAPEIKAAIDREAHRLLESIASFDFRGGSERGGDGAGSADGEAAAAVDGEPVGGRRTVSQPRGKRRARKMANRKS